MTSTKSLYGRSLLHAEISYHLRQPRAASLPYLQLDALMRILFLISASWHLLFRYSICLSPHCILYHTTTRKKHCDFTDARWRRFEATACSMYWHTHYCRGDELVYVCAGQISPQQSQHTSVAGDTAHWRWHAAGVYLHAGQGMGTTYTPPLYIIFLRRRISTFFTAPTEIHDAITS